MSATSLSLLASKLLPLVIFAVAPENAAVDETSFVPVTVTGGVNVRVALGSLLLLFPNPPLKASGAPPPPPPPKRWPSEPAVIAD